ncbi:MAG: hypothetical protein LBR22_01925 [Desulfovibrio sp.]|nr:hypothetical protein [Desulfovibrio sp.]
MSNAPQNLENSLKIADSPHDAYSSVTFSQEEFASPLFEIIYDGNLDHFDLDTLKNRRSVISTGLMKQFRPDIILTCLVTFAIGVLAPFIWEFKAFDSPYTIVQLLDYYAAYIHTYRRSIKKGIMLCPCVTLIMHGARKELVDLAQFCRIKDPTGLFRAPLLNIKIFYLSEISDMLIDKGWPWTFPIFVMKYYDHSDIVNLMVEKFTDLLTNHNKDGIFSDPIANAMLYISTVRDLETTDEISRNLIHILGDLDMELDPRILNRTQNFYAKTKQETRQKTLHECLLLAVEKRFPTAPQSLSTSILGIHESDQLMSLMNEVLTSGSLNAFTNAVDATLQRQSQGV